MNESNEQTLMNEIMKKSNERTPSLQKKLFRRLRYTVSQGDVRRGTKQWGIVLGICRGFEE